MKKPERMGKRNPRVAARNRAKHDFIAKRVTVNGVNSNEKFKNCMKSSRVRLTSLSYSVIIMENKKWILEEFNSILWEEYRL